MATLSSITFIILFSLLGQDNVLIEQHGAEVRVGDVDSYIHDLPNDIRRNISFDKFQLEKDILGMLNMNIINQYLKDSKLIDDPYFQAVIEDIKQSDNELDDEFINRMGLSVEVFKKSYQDYLTKKALYAALKDYILQDIDRKQAEKLAYDRYRTAKSDYVKPEQRDLAMIQLSQDKYSQQEALTLVKQLMADDTVSAFSAKAQELSEDSTAEMNSGQLGLFKQSGFRFPFAETVFDADIGVLPAVFEKDSNWYIVRVNKIVPAETIPFDQVKDKMVTDIMNHSMRRRFQSIITQYAQYEVQVNKDLVDDIFTRYEVFQ